MPSCRRTWRTGLGYSQKSFAACAGSWIKTRMDRRAHRGVIVARRVATRRAAEERGESASEGIYARAQEEKGSFTAKEYGFVFASSAP